MNRLLIGVTIISAGSLVVVGVVSISMVVRTRIHSRRRPGRAVMYRQSASDDRLSRAGLLERLSQACASSNDDGTVLVEPESEIANE